MEKWGAPNAADSNHVQADKRNETKLDKEQKEGKEKGNSVMVVHIWTKQCLS